ncbi:MAG: hypothetical protein H8E16_20065 [Flavobacteriales bacterium]|nr:hypothetical protein [Flavobacteriales bacterium]
MIQELKDNYGHLFEDALLNEINQVGTFNEVPEGFKMINCFITYINSLFVLVSHLIFFLF